MKKLLNISVIAALAILPLAANAANGDIITVTDPATAASAEQTANAVTSGTSPKYALAVEAANDDKVATASYVKGAYNAAIKAINKVSETADSAVKGVQVNGADLTLTNGKANVTVAEGSTNGTIAVNDTDVAVHGLGSAAYTSSDAYDAAGSAAAAEAAAKSYADGLASNYDAAGTAAGVQTAIEGKFDDGASGYDIDAKTLKVQGADVLTGASLTDYAKKTGVTNTISASSISGTVQTVATWGSTTTSTTPIAATITGATYTETAPQQQGGGNS